MEHNNLPATQQENDAISALLSKEAIKKRFEQVLGKKAAGFMSSVISAVNSNGELKKANPMTVVAAAAVAASLDLPINPSLGFAHIVPYKKDGIPIAQFQMGWRGFVQLGMRSGQYKTINTCAVYEGELIESNRFTGEMFFDENKRTSDKIVGYVAYFKLINGFEKYLYMTVEQIHAHGKQYSKSYSNAKGKWQTDFESMALKTPLKLLLSRWGILSLEMQSAVQYDQAAIKTMDGAYEYVDNPENNGDVIDAESTTTAPEETDADLLAKFDASIPKDTDPEILKLFIVKNAAHNKTTDESVKLDAAKNLPGFWKVYAAFQKIELKKKKATDQKTDEKKPETEEMAKAECPENPGTTYTKKHCDECKTKKEGMCKVW
ncbi:MAG: recombination and repair protein RecT [Smithella sp. PtaU1.Bin162]|nr:MAG: recombination and repair protein RecT [Smithella sp. PtaU1.Bin162]